MINNALAVALVEDASTTAENIQEVILPVLEVDLTSKVNLAQQQNEIPFFRSLLFRNQTSRVLENVTVRITSDPEFLVSREWRVDRIAIDGSFRPKDKDVTLSRVFLAERREAVRATVSVVVECQGEELGRVEQPILVLAPDEWGGIEHLPELTAAFALPNDPVVEKILKDAALLLKASGKDISLDGYQKKDKKRVYTQISAIYNAIAKLGLDYASPPASFERVGQKVRTPDRIVDSGLATCFDLTLLMTACFEQCGLNPLILFTEGHSFVGCWLIEDDFSTASISDSQAIRKRQQLGELIVIETTLLTKNPIPTLKVAAESALKYLADEELFECAIDVRRARMGHIRPIMESSPSHKITRDASAMGTSLSLDDDWDALPDVEVVHAEKPSTPEARIEHWKQRLLDLTKRNPLLNFKSTKSSVPIYCHTPAEMEDKIAAHTKLKLIPIPPVMAKDGPRSAELFEERHHQDALKEYAEKALNKGDLLVELTEQDMNARLTDLYRKARLELEEGGANTLFITIGSLHWKESESSEKTCKAPLLLLPVSLERQSVQSGFRLIARDEEPLLNPTLIEMLKQDFHLVLPNNLENELPTDHSGLDVSKILHTIRHAVRDIRGWEITEEVVLSTFSFTKYLMWKDLQTNAELLKENPVVKHLIDTPQEPYREQGKFPDSGALDKDYHPIDTFCPVSADAYQMAAIYNAAEGKDFVLIGPPGTGKSQTITNMIVQLIATGKTVLFVSEKMVALNVVYRRLQAVGLGEFCLELHSSKANKKDVVSQLGKAWDSASNINAAIWTKHANALADIRSKLNTYPKQLHRRYRNGLTAYLALGTIIQEREQSFVSLSWSNEHIHTEEELDSLRELTKRLSVSANDTGMLSEHPFKAISKGEWSPVWQDDFQRATREFLAACEMLRKEKDSALKALSLSSDTMSFVQIQGLESLCLHFQKLNNRSLAFAFSANASDICSGLEQVILHGKTWKRHASSLSQPYHNNGIELNELELRIKWETVCNTVHQITSQQLQNIIRSFKATNKEAAYTDMSAVKEISNCLGAIRDHALALSSYASKLSQAYKNDCLDIDEANLAQQWNKAKDEWWPKSSMSRKSVIKTLMQNALNEQPISEESVEAELENIALLKREENALNELSAYYGLFGTLWQAKATDWDKAKELINALQDVHQVLQLMQLATISKVAPSIDHAISDLHIISLLKSEAAVLDQFAECTAPLGRIWQGTSSDWDALEEVVVWARQASPIIACIAGDNVDLLLQARQHLQRLVSEGRDLLAPTGSIGQKVQAYITAFSHFREKQNVLNALANFNNESLNDGTNDPLIQLESQLKSWLDGIGLLRHWCTWRKIREQAIGLQLTSLIEAMESNSITADEVSEVFERSYRKWWVTKIASQDSVLRNFMSSEHERLIKDFRDQDENYIKLTQSYVKGILSGKIPPRTQFSKQTGNEWGILNRELEKKAKLKPLRQLLSELPTALTCLTPCLLMSPLSIAQYLSAGGRRFDVVVFDEASQIPVWDAIGAIARGSQTIVVGDPKQLPPTDFFNRKSDGSDSDGSVVEDLESVLDECLAANIPKMQLNWHYRSRHESLITFSNHRYYGGNLLTFPSPVTQDTAVSYKHVPKGFYEKGTGQINRAEAEAVVTRAVKLLKSPDFNREKNPLTLGIVTFNQKQQTLIEDMLDRARREDPTLEPHFAETKDERVLIKNLENVQGDERDIILFSLTYGPDQAGKVSMNFGPLNRDGGERRLNVVITRARQGLEVFGTLRADHIDLSRTNAQGVVDLKHFLQFAERGHRALAEAIMIPGGEADSQFEIEVASALRKRGWQVHLQIGVSGYRIDLGVVNPDAQGTYLAGVECDGAAYHSSANARDRDKLREQVLRSLGWEILRVWSTDWWHDGKRCTDKLDAALQKLLSDARARAAEAVAAVEIEAQIQTVQEDEAIVNITSLVEENFSIPTQASEPPAPPFLYASVETNHASHIDGLAYYKLSNPRSAVDAINPDQFHDVSENKVVAAMITNIVEAEGPIALDLLAERIARTYGFKRTGARILERVLKLASTSYRITQEHQQSFVWPNNALPDNYQSFRITPKDMESPRTHEQICRAELNALAAHVRATDYPADEKQLIRCIADKLGFRRLTENIYNHIKSSIS